MLYTILKPDELRGSLGRIFPDVRISEFGPSCWIFSTTHLNEETSNEFVRLREVDGMYGGISQTTWKTVEEQETVEQRVERLRTGYRDLEEQWEHSHFWSTEHIAFHQIGAALQSSDPVQALQERVEKAQKRLAEKEQILLDGLFHGNPESFRKHYGTLIALFTTALQELRPDLVMRTWKQVLDQKRVEATEVGSTGLISTRNSKRNGQIIQSLDNRSLYSVRNLETKEEALAITADCVDAALQRLGIMNSGWT